MFLEPMYIGVTLYRGRNVIPNPLSFTDHRVSLRTSTVTYLVEYQV